jgi:DNA polymerase elongation subunit (family B)
MSKPSGVRILMLDIETAPHLAAIWGLYDQNVATNQIIKPGYTLCWAAKWYGEKEVMFSSILDGERKMVRDAHKLLTECDAVCHYNGTKFDIPTLNKEFLLLNLSPPAPYKQIDLLKTARSRFRLASNKLDYVAKQLGLGEKVAHKGFDLWLECMAKKADAWREMKRYNKHDVVLLEKVYERLLPWIKGHPNVSAYTGARCCPTCGSEKAQAHGYAILNSRTYQRIQCTDCRSWYRLQKSMKAEETTQAVN